MNTFFLSNYEFQFLTRSAKYSSPRVVRLKYYYSFFLVCCGCDTSYIVSVHIQCQATIYTLSLCRGHSWRVRIAKQETLTPPGHLFSPLVCRGPWMSSVVFFCWCHSDSASVLLYFTLAEVSFLYSNYLLSWWVLVDQRAPEGTRSQVPWSTSVDL